MATYWLKSRDAVEVPIFIIVVKVKVKVILKWLIQATSMLTDGCIHCLNMQCGPKKSQFIDLFFKLSLARSAMFAISDVIHNSNASIHYLVKY